MAKRTPRTSVPISLPDATLAYVEAIARLSGENISTVIGVLLAAQLHHITQLLKVQHP